MIDIKKNSKLTYLLPEAEWPGQPELFQSATSLANSEGIGFVYLASGQGLRDLMRTCPPHFIARHPEGRVIVLSAARNGRPRNPEDGFANRDYAIEEQAREWMHLDLPEEAHVGWNIWLREQVAEWLDIPKEPSDEVQAIGSLVKLTDPSNVAALFLTGRSPSIKKVVDALDRIKRAYRLQIGGKVGDRRDKVLSPLDALLAADKPNEELYRAVAGALEHVVEGVAIPRRFSDVKPDALPRVLILGPSGSGKSVVVNYLARRTSPQGSEITHRPQMRVPLPSFSKNEQLMEFELFGYMRGSYTDARPNGSPGVLMSHLGGIVFLDEIGEATPALQAKLLAFLDDYRVTPRGWYGKGIYCPLMLVAATNRPIDLWAAQYEQDENAGHGRFRHDLYQRFTHIIRLPGLDERKEDLPELVDGLLQLDWINAGQRITGITHSALKALSDIDFSQGNFRALQNKLQQACQRASCRRSKIIQVFDLVF
ncbi:sigma 54-interacting transcriptional regulator [Candidatus Symbiobacter mobilis]|uniref:Transcriptional regulator n=1 Tax=Candidatus Symbiobacter mobilis CR TaxID=946483 RepID=U5NBE2_9BURK|nr:sigma 54-interacting transcriptional regulator [Candidatus Symbiobacter mobilis]AGX88742.1 transcriptional regulator [Candidatus Symbiobacter mobilis CR]